MLGIETDIGISFRADDNDAMTHQISFESGNADSMYWKMINL